jgi:hypothetical protein
VRAKEAEAEELRRTVANLQRAIQHHQDDHEQSLRLKDREQAEDKMLLQNL